MVNIKFKNPTVFLNFFDYMVNENEIIHLFLSIRIIWVPDDKV